MTTRLVQFKSPFPLSTFFPLNGEEEERAWIGKKTEPTYSSMDDEEGLNTLETVHIVVIIINNHN